MTNLDSILKSRDITFPTKIHLAKAMVFPVVTYGYESWTNDNPICKTEEETQMYRTEFWTLWEKASVGCFERTASKHVYYLG